MVQIYRAQQGRKLKNMLCIVFLILAKNMKLEIFFASFDQASYKQKPNIRQKHLRRKFKAEFYELLCNALNCIIQY